MSAITDDKDKFQSIPKELTEPERLKQVLGIILAQTRASLGNIEIALLYLADLDSEPVNKIRGILEKMRQQCQEQIAELEKHKK